MTGSVANPDRKDPTVPPRAWNEGPLETKRQFFNLIRQGSGGQGVSNIERPIGPRDVTENDRIEIARD